MRLTTTKIFVTASLAGCALALLATHTSPVFAQAAAAPDSSMSNMSMPDASMQGMGGMSMGQPSSATPKAASTANLPFPGYGPNGPPSDQTDAMAGMTMPGMKMAGKADGVMDMQPLKMPQLQEQGTYVATGHEDWKVGTGFGKNAGMVGMMSQMMVGGSGMEGMKMPAMKMNFDKQNYTGDSQDTAIDSSSPASSTTTEVQAQPATSRVSTGTGDTKAPATDTMPGMNMSTPTAPPSAPKLLTISGSISHPVSGDNVLTLTVTDSAGKPVSGAKITTTVTMTSMDMGTTHPSVTEMGNGKYESTVAFGMSGPWRIVVKVSPAGGGVPQLKTFDFDAK